MPEGKLSGSFSQGAEQHIGILQIFVHLGKLKNATKYKFKHAFVYREAMKIYSPFL